MKFSWNAPLSKSVMLQQEYGTKDLRFFGISTGWIGIGILVGVDRPSAPVPDALEKKHAHWCASRNGDMCDCGGWQPRR